MVNETNMILIFIVFRLISNGPEKPSGCVSARYYFYNLFIYFFAGERQRKLYLILSLYFVFQSSLSQMSKTQVKCKVKGSSVSTILTLFC